MSAARLTALEAWLQAEDDELLYSADGETADNVSLEDRFNMLRAALRTQVISSQQYIEACLALCGSVNPVTGTPLTLEG